MDMYLTLENGKKLKASMWEDSVITVREPVDGYHVVADKLADGKWYAYVQGSDRTREILKKMTNPSHHVDGGQETPDKAVSWLMGLGDL